MSRFTIVPSPLEQRVGQTISERLHDVATAGAQLKDQLNSTLTDPELAAKSSHFLADLVAPTGLPFALLCVLLIVFALVYGAANGINTMLRAIAMPELVSRSQYATLNGLMMTPVLLAQASAPWLGALLWRASDGYAAVEWAMVAAALIALAAFAYGLRHAQKRPIPAATVQTAPAPR